jgi:hexosaminidase
MKRLLLLLTLLLTICGYSQRTARRTAPLIPLPTYVKWGDGSFTFSTKTSIVYSGDDEMKKIAEHLAFRIEKATGHKPAIRKGTAAASNSIFLKTAPFRASSPAPGGYTLEVNQSNITITSLPQNASGMFYGVQTLLQLFPYEVERNKKQELSEWIIPQASIQDKPRFGWRGLMLDVSRHFFTVDQVKDFIDQMVKYKFNILHLHLTDDQGWRIQIKSLPKLTEVGAWRVDRTGTFGTLSKPLPGEKATYGGFYTHEDIKDLVKYASDRFVNIVPEIDVPGHSLAALASYPELSCTPGEYYVSPGDRFMIWPGGGQHFYGLLDNTICPANEKAYEFLDKVFTEVAQLFPFEYIHMGGDETARNFWEKNDQIKALMQKENLKDLDEVQSYFVKRVEKIINSKGKKMIGWDEILQGGLAPNAAVMSWRGAKGGIEAAKLGHEVVMSPNDFVYVDLMQGDGIIEPPVYSSIRLKKTYQFEPIPPGVDSSFIKGGQANLWAEQLYTVRHMQYMLWPRAFAVAEVLWSPKQERNWNDFTRRVESHFQRFDAAEVKYSPSMFDPIFEFSKKDTATIIVKLSTEVEGLDIHYSFDNSFPDNYYPKYESPLTVPKDAANLKVITYRRGKPIGRMITMPMSEMKKRSK